jgi:hypothetical protein
MTVDVVEALDHESIDEGQEEDGGKDAGKDEENDESPGFTRFPGSWWGVRCQGI